MNPQHLTFELRREPYIPLRLCLSDGSFVDVPDPNIVFIEGSSLFIIRPGPVGVRLLDGHDIISLLHIVRVVRMPDQP